MAGWGVGWGVPEGGQARASDRQLQRVESGGTRRAVGRPRGRVGRILPSLLFLVRAARGFDQHHLHLVGVLAAVGTRVHQGAPLMSRCDY